MALTTIPSAGAKLRASVLSSLITEVRPVHAYKSSSEIVSNSTTLQNDDHLFVSVAASVVYNFRLQLIYEAGTTADYKYALTFPAGALMAFGTQSQDTAAAYFPSGQSTYTSGTALTAGGSGIGTIRSILITGTLEMSTTAGTLQYQWAQNSAVVENTVTRYGAYLVLYRMT
jgi:hypothetical protein